MKAKGVFTFLITIATLFSVIFAAGVTKEDLQKQPNCNRSCEAMEKARTRAKMQSYPRCATLDGSSYTTMSKFIMQCYVWYCNSVKYIAHMGECKKSDHYPEEKTIKKRKVESPCLQFCSNTRGTENMCVATDATRYQSMSNEKFSCLKQCGQFMELSHPGTCHKSEPKPFGPFKASEAPTARSNRELIYFLAHRKVI